MGFAASGYAPAMLATIRLPVDWNGLGFPDPFAAGRVSVCSGARGWGWSDRAPDLGVAAVPIVAGLPAPNWDIDHVVLLVPDLDHAVALIEAAHHAVRRRIEVSGRRTAFFLVGTLLEVVEEESVDRPLLWGVALQTDTSLADLAAIWRSTGHDVTDPRPAFQEGRDIITVGHTGAGVAVMTRGTVETKAG